MRGIEASKLCGRQKSR